MRFQIDNFLGVERAEIELVPGTISVVSGTNASGKSSLATAVAGALAYDPNPLEGAKGSGNVYLRDDQDSGGVLVDEGGDPVVRWQAASGDLAHFATEDPPTSAASVGLVDFIAQIPAPARAELWEGYFLPPFADMKAMIRKQLKPHIPAKVLTSIMERLDKDDDKDDEDNPDLRARARIDEVAASYKSRARDAKADWTSITGEAYGVRKAADWLPNGWTAALDGLQADQTEEAVSTARDAVQAQHVGHAVSVAEASRGREAKKALVGAEKVLAVCQETLQDAAARLDEAQTAIQSERAEGTKKRLEMEAHVATEPRQASYLVCPSCKQELLMRDGELVHFEPEIIDASHAKWEELRAALDTELDGMADSVRKKMTAAKPLEESHDDALQARHSAQLEVAKLTSDAKNAEAEVKTEEMVEAVREAEADLEEAKARDSLVKRRVEAMKHHTNVVHYTLISEILGPKGVRATAMEAKMLQLDKTLDTVAKVTGWPKVAISRTYSVSIGKRQFLRACAKSERLCAQYSLQIAVARCLRDPFVVLDEADTLVDHMFAGLKNLMAALRARPDPPAFLVCGSNLDVAHLNQDGLNYVIENGVMSQQEERQ